VSHLNLELYNRVDNLRRADERQRAELWRLSQPAWRDRPSWVAQQGCRLLCQLGRWMISLGRQLQQVGLSNATS
jgi:hypothetical protein